jgi:hypothetical protein
MMFTLESNQYFVLTLYRVYTLLTILGEIGGIYNFILILGTITVSYFNRKLLFAKIISKFIYHLNFIREKLLNI